MPHVHNALHHFTPEQDGYRRFLREADEPFNGIERAGETLTPILNLWDVPELAYLRGEMLCSGFNSQAAVALELSAICFQNETTNKLIVIDRLIVNVGGAAGRFRVGFDARPAGATKVAQSRFRRDERWGTQQPALSIFADTNVATALNFGQTEYTGILDQDVTIPGPWILEPGGQALIVERVTVNLAINHVAADWRERVVGVSELAG